MRYRAVTLTLCAVFACGGRSDAPALEPTIRVENGVTIVENPGVHIADSSAWSIDTAAAVSVGVVDGPEEYVIGRLDGMLRLPDGTILVADGIAHELRVFDARGRFARKVGRAGNGPGEYGWLSGVLHHTGDSIVVMDNEDSRANVLDPSLEFVRRYHPRLRDTRARSGSSHRLIGFFSDGEQLISDFLNVCGPRRSNGFCEDSVAFFRTDSAGNATARFGSFVYQRRESFQVRVGLSTGWTEPHPQSMWAVRDDRFYYADASRFEIQVFSGDGRLERIVRVLGTPPQYGKKDVWPDEPSLPPAGDPNREQIRRVAANARAGASLPERFPSFSDLIVDMAGNIWIREYLPARHLTEQQARWFVFDPEGRLRWELPSPPGLSTSFRPYANVRPDIGTDYVLTSRRDPDGVESVVLYPLRKQR